MVGDLALLGMDLHGFVVAHRSGHHTNAALVRRLLQSLEKEKEHAHVPPAIPLRMTARSISRESSRSCLTAIRCLLVDRVLEVEPGRSLVAVKNVSANEPFFQGHWPGRPIMPGVLIIEAMAQAAGVLIAASVRLERAGRHAGLGRRRQAPPAGGPGDQLRLEIRPTNQAELGLRLRRRQGGRRRGRRGQDPVRHGRRPRRRLAKIRRGRR